MMSLTIQQRQSYICLWTCLLITYVWLSLIYIGSRMWIFLYICQWPLQPYDYSCLCNNTLSTTNTFKCDAMKITRESNKSHDEDMLVKINWQHVSLAVVGLRSRMGWRYLSSVNVVNLVQHRSICWCNDNFLGDTSQFLQFWVAVQYYVTCSA